MQTEIEVKILLDENFRISKTELGVNVNDPISHKAMDFILFEVFSQMADKFNDKIKYHNHNEKLD